ncbi:MAG TPA: tetratricopeptide repeat protein [Bacteroidales bacterium]|jgi:tetratricopeptide (TPR) repeat protein|nr:tetratricopeptide repeat protein [Bacteroidales bacterium]MDI9573542.1 tetratricopeptide repeat protein [Bacteroidota bacterium]OQC59619.1 MAG: photosystem I assembly protein Ycf3 [Bacteroidetes bacterium ADurb.Bin012]MBP9511987.1 tetratricopeptide repeat protein [Bacteroidales bacterium]MBP9588590.1 tetratricopeptide repeat protein [Bacteroidales bacterium]
MKRFLLTIFIACSVSIAWSQTAKRTTAYNFLRNGKLDKALENIEPCLTHPKTMNEAKTWFYRGNIYLQIGLSEKPEYKALSDNPFQIAYESYQKALTLEGANEFKLDIIQNMNVIAEGFYVKGVERFNGQDYSSAANLFIEAAKVKEEIGVFDTAAVYNAGLCAELSNDNKLALTQYRKVYEAGLRKPNIYTSLINVSLKSGDTTTAMNYATEGLQLFPEDFSILIAETNIFLAKNMTEQALKNLEIAKSLDQTNPSIFFAVGVSYDRLGNFQKAEEAYLKAIELKPDYFDAIYNLGALYVNKAATTLDEANLLPLEKEKEYNEMKNLAESHLDKAIPFLEKAHQLDPKDRNTIASLKEIYARKGNVEKAKEMDEKLKMQ